MKKQQGFTLIELMIVVAIIGVLSAIAIPAYENYVKKSELASAMATMKSLITPAELKIQSEGDISGGLATLGMSSGANTLGQITTPTTTSAAVMLFTFNKGSLNANKIKISRSSDGWTCIQDSDIETNGCNKSSTIN